MRAITIEEILRRVEMFERNLAGFYEKIAEETNVDGVRLLIDYMGRHRNRIEDALSRIPPEQMRRILKVPLQYEPHIPGAHCLKVVKLATDAGPRKIIEAAIEFDECMVQMFRQISLQPVHKDVREFFASLQLLEENDQLKLEKVKEMFNVYI